MTSSYFFKPTLKSFLISIIYDLLPITIAIIVTIFMKKEISVYHKIMNIIMGITSFVMLSNSVFVHLNHISIQDQGIILKSIGKPYCINWTLIKKAAIRERKTIYNRMDRLIILHLHNGNIISYPSSILSKRDENYILL